jgi:hypothetical protein
VLPGGLGLRLVAVRLVVVAGIGPRDAASLLLVGVSRDHWHQDRVPPVLSREVLRERQTRLGNNGCEEDHALNGAAGGCDG